MARAPLLPAAAGAMQLRTVYLAPPLAPQPDRVLLGAVYGHTPHAVCDLVSYLMLALELCYWFVCFAIITPLYACCLVKLRSVDFTHVFVQVRIAAITTRVKLALQYRDVAGAIRPARVYPAA